jgi:murein DD-endopeptidase MepM/ murein hydrolase activator NlpD
MTRKAWLLMCVAVGAAAVTWVVLNRGKWQFFQTGTASSATPAVVANTPQPEVQIQYGMVINGLHTTEAGVQRNQTFVDLLRGYAVAPAAMRQLANVAHSTFDFRKIVAGKKYTVFSEPDSVRTLRALVYEASPVEYAVFHFRDSLWLELCRRDVVAVEKGVAGEVQYSLSETVESMGLSHELTNRFVDIFAWVVDFQRLQKGDRFKILYDELQVEGKPYAIGKIHGIRFEHAGRPLHAFPLDQGEGTDFFDDEGNSLRKALLKYPIEFTRISSRYNLNRFHPVAKVFRAHLGTDFAAPAGTPIRSVGDGLVEEAQYKANNGNYVKVRHNASYTTAYLHMSKIATGVRAGARVSQGQVIGYVGSTGLATGPHLCYRFWKNGVQIDALRVELPPSQPIHPQNLATFNLLKKTIKKQLESIEHPAVLPEVVVVAGALF